MDIFGSCGYVSIAVENKMNDINVLSNSTLFEFTHNVISKSSGANLFKTDLKPSDHSEYVYHVK
jgi:hypothetical protein